MSCLIMSTTVATLIIDGLRLSTASSFIPFLKRLTSLLGGLKELLGTATLDASLRYFRQLKGSLYPKNENIFCLPNKGYKLNEKNSWNEVVTSWWVQLDSSFFAVSNFVYARGWRDSPEIKVRFPAVKVNQDPAIHDVSDRSNTDITEIEFWAPYLKAPWCIHCRNCNPFFIHLIQAFQISLTCYCACPLPPAFVQ